MNSPLPLLCVLLGLGLAAPLSAADTPAPAAAPAEKAYPLETCVVSGEALGSMGDPYVHLHQEPGKPDREVRFCCKGCLKKFSKDPAKHLARLDAAEKAAAEKAAAPAADAHAGHSH